MKWLGLDWDEGPGGGRRMRPLLPDPALRHLCRGALETPEGARHASTPASAPKDELDAKRAKAEAEEGGYCRAMTARAATSTPPRLPAPHRSRRAARVAPEGARTSHGPIEFDDAVYGHMSFPADVMDDMIVVRTDGTPTYNFAVVCDDANMGITPRHPRRRPPVQHPAPDPHLRGPGLRRARLRAPVHDLGLRRPQARPSATAPPASRSSATTASCPTPW